MPAPAANPDPQSNLTLEELETQALLLEHQLQTRLLLAWIQAIDKLTSLLQTTTDPVELRRLCDGLARFGRRAAPPRAGRTASPGPARPPCLGRPATLVEPGLIGPAPAPQAPQPRLEAQPPTPVARPSTPETVLRDPLPPPTSSTTPQTLVASVLRALAEASTPRPLAHALKHTLCPGALDQGRFTPAFLLSLASSPAWLCKDRIPELGSPVIQGQTATLRVLFPLEDQPQGAPAPSCTFHLRRRSTSTSGPLPRWLLSDITTNTS